MGLDANPYRNLSGDMVVTDGTTYPDTAVDTWEPGDESADSDGIFVAPEPRSKGFQWIQLEGV